MSILAALDDPDLFRGVIRTPATFPAWRAFLAALFGLPSFANQRQPAGADANARRLSTGQSIRA
jgi:hypothetical protein